MMCGVRSPCTRSSIRMTGMDIGYICLVTSNSLKEGTSKETDFSFLFSHSSLTETAGKQEIVLKFNKSATGLRMAQSQDTLSLLQE